MYGEVASMGDLSYEKWVVRGRAAERIIGPWGSFNF